MTKFELDEFQLKKFEDWRKSKSKLPPSTIGGAYSFCFCPTGVGMMIVVKCVDGTELDLTDYSSW